MSADFSIGEFNFRVGNLKVKQSLSLFKRLTKTLMPALMAGAEAEAAGQPVAGHLKAIVSDLDCIDEAFEAFAGVAEYTGPDRPNFTALKPLQEQVFGGRTEMLLEFVGQCVYAEYGAFLKGNGPLAGLLAKAGLAKRATTAAPKG